VAFGCVKPREVLRNLFIRIIIILLNPEINVSVRYLLLRHRDSDTTTNYKHWTTAE